MNAMKIEITTDGAARAAISAALPALDAHIEELIDKLEKARLLRRSMAAAGDVDRRGADSSFVEKLLDGAQRSHFEGDSYDSQN